MADDAFVLKDVHLRAPDGNDILKGMTFTHPAGQVGTIVGPSGAGKSRLLRLLNRLAEPTSGTIEIFGKSIADWEIPTLRQDVGLVTQTPVLTRGTVLEALRVLTKFKLVDEETFDAQLTPTLSAVQLESDILERQTADISGGERQRVAIARALMLSPRALLLDEPTSALDGPTATGLLSALKTWQTANAATVLVVTHRIQDAEALGGQLVVMMDGAVEDAGQAAAMLSGKTTEKARDFLAGREAQA
jgi:ABC-type methionine transport system ATPase subunit